MSVSILSRRRCRGVRVARVRTDAVQLLRALGVDGELSVALVDDTEMRALNARYRQRDRPTDVLSFGVQGSRPAGGAAAMLGDVVISVDTAARQATARGVPVAEEVRFLLTHGVLHLLGYDHERSRADARRMFAKQRRLRKRLETDDCAQKPRAIVRDRAFTTKNTKTGSRRARRPY